jgi:hypothetical protein
VAVCILILSLLVWGISSTSRTYAVRYVCCSCCAGSRLRMICRFDSRNLHRGCSKQVESECNQVAAGTKQKNEIMTPILQKMSQIFHSARSEASKLDAAIARRFARVGADFHNSQVVQQQFSLCGVCNSMMALKHENSHNHQNGNNNNNRNGKVLYCQTCRDGYRLPSRGTITPKTQGDNAGPVTKCPICSFQVIQIKRGEGYDGNGYTLCPKCSSDPPIEHGGQSDGRDFPCYKCLHPTCSLATGTRGSDVDVFPCPFCSQSNQQTNQSVGQVRLKGTQKGSVMLSCSNYSSTPQCRYCIWLPKAASKIDVDDASCPNCSTNDRSVRLLKFTWKPGGVPPPYDRETVVCILCDGRFRQDLQVSLPQPNQVGINHNRRPTRAIRGSGSGGRGRGRGRGRGTWR